MIFAYDIEKQYDDLRGQGSDAYTVQTVSDAMGALSNKGLGRGNRDDWRARLLRGEAVTATANYGYDGGWQRVTVTPRRLRGRHRIRVTDTSVRGAA